MKKTLLIMLTVLLSITNIAAQKIARVEMKEFDSQFFPFPRTLLIYTPESYDECTQTDYDVVYVFDAQCRSNFDEVQALLHYGVQQPNNDRSYIVVGISSPYLAEFDYDRGNDFLPVPEHIKISHPYYGNQEKFKKFLKEELMPYIDSTYRTTGHTLGIGHSLGASFVIDAMVNDDIFDDVIAISPNFGWDEYRFANNLMNFDYSGRPRFIYMTMGNEGLDESGEFPDWWREGWNKVKDYVANTIFPSNITIKAMDFPMYSHNEAVLPVHLTTLKEWAAYRHNPAFNDEKLYPVHIELTGSSVEGDVYITGNQKALGEWNPQLVKMDVADEHTRYIDLELRLPAEFKFTQGNWESGYYIENGDCGNIRISSPDKTNKHYSTF